MTIPALAVVIALASIPASVVPDADDPCGHVPSALLAERGVAGTLELPHHGLRAGFADGRTSLSGIDGSWSSHFELHSSGRGGATIEAISPIAGSATSDRVTFERPGSTEWWILRDGALQHGFTVHDRPAGRGDLVFSVGVEGSVRPQVDADGRGAVFCDASGRVRFEYRGLIAFDADGDDLPARMVRTDAGFDLVVDDRGADYPVTIDPVVRRAYLKAPALDVQDYFGTAVAMDGDTIVVGATGEDSAATGINGDPTDNSLSASGAAYVFRRSGGAWIQEAYVKPNVAGVDDLFGAHVDIDGNLMVIGAPWESSDATGDNGDPNNDNEPFSGAAYVFARLGSTWAQRVYLKASNTDTLDGFGGAVAISGNRIAIGAPYEDSDATGVGGDQTNDNTKWGGAVYVFRLVGVTFVQEAYIKASNTGVDDRFGWSVDLDGDTLVVGAIGEGSSATGVNGNQSSDAAPQSGAVYVFERTGGTWTQQAYLKASNTGTGDRFGWSVALDGDTLITGAPNEESIATGVNGDGSNDFQPASGAAYVFVRNGSTWSQQAYVKSSNTDLLDKFGMEVALEGDLAAVGAELESSGADGIDGNQADNSEVTAGAAYLFVRSGTSWSQRAYIKAPNSGDNQYFGAEIAISGDDLAIGEPLENGATTGVGGDPFTTGVIRSGAVHVYDAGLWSTFEGCAGNAATLHPPAGSVYLGSTTALSIETDAIASGVAATYFGAPGIDPSGCGTPLPGGGEALLAFAPLPVLLGLAPLSAGAGTQTLVVPPLPGLVGQRLVLQSAAVDPISFDSELTNALAIEIVP